MPASDLTDRVRLVVGTRSYRDVAKLTGVSAETVRRVMSGSEPSSAFLAGLSDRLGINAEWLLTGRGSMLLEGVYADALRHASVEQIVAEIARKFDEVSDRVARLEVAVFAPSRPATGGPVKV